MPITIVVGMQWGDEGKGRVVDLLSENADIVARFNGGDNAGHTVTVGEEIFKLHLIPSGVIHPHPTCVLGNGVVLNPATLLEEMDSLRQAGIPISPDRLWISDSAHLITPAHRLLDRARESALGKAQIGTTGRGIGPAYMAKTARGGIRCGDLLHADSFPDRVREHFESASEQLTALYHQPVVENGPLVEEFIEQATRLIPFIRPVGARIREALAAGQSVLAEGAQGTLLDLDQGTYPFVTSSCTTAAGIFSGLGIGICPIERVVGITKAFQTRVGGGPFPTELEGETAAFLRGTGVNPWDEFGTTTGRPRRVGWLDLVLLKYAIEINGSTELFLTKLDILSGLDQILVCTSYNTDGTAVLNSVFSAAAENLQQYQPVYESLPGWKEDLCSLRQWNDLPTRAMEYVKFIEAYCGIPVTQISVGSERSAVIARS
jgi:adenylosuccinate synthase